MSIRALLFMVGSFFVCFVIITLIVIEHFAVMAATRTCP